MGNLLLSTGLFKTDATTSDQASNGEFEAKKISHGITYYYTLGAVTQTTSPDQSSQPPGPLLSLSPSAAPLSDSSSAAASSSPLLSDSPSDTPVSSQNQSHSEPTARPLLVFFSWLGARPAAVAKYRDLYMDRGMDVLLVQSRVTHFLWPRWGLEYGLEVLNILEEPQFSQRTVLVHASSIGGYTFTQILTHIAEGPKQHSGLAQRVIGHIYDSLVVGSLEHMAIGLGKTLMPRIESFIRNTAMLYFWLFKSHTANFYENSIQVFHNSPITTPALFFFSENDAMCNCVVLEKVIDLWRKRGVAVESRKWKKSIHAAHMRCHPEDYLFTLQHYLNSLPILKQQCEAMGK
ncbi:transmembrane protein 53-like [Stegastes partitus]|uniref:Transmembrane protein 53-like n=1 Tax=Stegastes partitus TaxID=144197 RepID=A0A3B5A302_9TELE|nr:PREDICTED: transmembrane protein 53-like [Stegastes partitus]